MPRMWTRLASLAGICLFAATAGAAELPDFTQLVERNGPAVVNVQAKHTGQEPPERSASPQDDSGDPEQEQVPEIFRRFFGIPGVPGPVPAVPSIMPISVQFLFRTNEQSWVYAATPLASAIGRTTGCRRLVSAGFVTANRLPTL